MTSTPTAAALAFANMAPGDMVTKAITVTNTGTLAQQYSMASVTSEDVFAAQLTLTVKTGVATCTNAGFGIGGGFLYGPSQLGSRRGTLIIGSAVLGLQPGDRTLSAGASEVLCAQVALKKSTPNGFASLTTTAVFTFVAEQSDK
ncbi:hypothetical protein [Tessaracoccus sp.]